MQMSMYKNGALTEQNKTEKKSKKKYKFSNITVINMYSNKDGN
jgi:hypothetical protein